MAFSSYFLFLTIILSISLSLQVTNAVSRTFLLPVVKDNIKTQYFTSFLVGTPQSTRVYLAIDLSNLWSWFTCDIYGYNHSTTFQPVHCRSPKCEAYGGIFCSGCNGALKPSCTNDTCGAEAYSPQSNGLYASGLIEDVISLFSLVPHSSQPNKALLRDFPFTCADKGPLKGLSPYTKGILTLARRPVALHAQISTRFKLPHKFALCLPALTTSIKSGLNGAMYFGGGPYNLGPRTNIDLAKSLVTTRLVINPNSTAPIYEEGSPSVEYFINVKSIKVDGTPVRFRSTLLSFDKDGIGGTKISTMDPYTVLHSDIYKALINIFVSKASVMNITTVASVSPFGACFSAKTIKNTKTGPLVPIIDFVLDGISPVLHNKNARWRFYGANSMVKISNSNVYCLGYVDGGSSPRTSIVIGGKQMEDYLVEFDLDADNLGISSSLVHMGTSCSQFKGI